MQIAKKIDEDYPNAVGRAVLNTHPPPSSFTTPLVLNPMFDLHCQRTHMSIPGVPADGGELHRPEAQVEMRLRFVHRGGATEPPPDVDHAERCHRGCFRSKTPPRPAIGDPPIVDGGHHPSLALSAANAARAARCWSVARSLRLRPASCVDMTELVGERRGEEWRVVARDRHVHAGPPERRDRVRLQRWEQPGADVRCRADVEPVLVADEPFQ